MKFSDTAIPGVRIIEPDVYSDSRGYFMEAFKKDFFTQHIGEVDFIQENESGSTHNVLRGLHYQLAPWSQAKLVRVISGCVLDVAVDLRQGSPTFGNSVTVELSGENKKQLFIPRGFAHGFRVLSESAVFTYLIDNPYMPQYERSIRYDDPDLGIDWQLGKEDIPILSEKDLQAPSLKKAEYNFNY